MMTDPRISVVIPCLNEEGSVEALHRELQRVLQGLGISYEIIFVDDGSDDSTPSLLREACRNDDHTGIITLTRSFGHQHALLAGLEDARGEIVLTMDGDLQHPPSLIPEMIRKLDEGFQVVSARRVKGHGRGFKAVGSFGFYWLINRLSDVSVPSGVADFRIMTRKALEDFLRFGERTRFSRGLVGWMGYQQGFVDFEAPPRQAGSSKYSARKMLSFAMDGISAFSPKPLRMAFGFGLLTAGAGLAYAIYALARYFSGNTVSGWTSLLITILVIGGVQLISLGLIGAYIARIFNETKGRPHYFVRERYQRP